MQSPNRARPRKQIPLIVRLLLVSIALVLLTAGLPGLVFGQQVQGVPRNGDPGTTESVARIMEREKAAPPRGNSIQVKKTGRAPDGRQDNPNSLTDPNWPPSTSSAPPSGITEHSRIRGLNAVVSALSQSLSTSFTAATLANSGFVPPDAMGAVGPSQILIVINGRVRTFTKAGVQDGAIDTSTNNFFSSVTGGNTTTDPRIIYDWLTQRWFVIMITDGVSPNRVMIAVSSGSTISSSSSFTFFQFQQDIGTSSGGTDNGDFGDFPTLGVDKFALYIGVNVFNPAGTAYLDSTVFVINKANLLATPTPSLTVTPFRAVATPNVGGDGPFSPAGVTNMDPNATEGYFVGPNTFTFGNLRFIRVSNPGGSPTITPLSLNVNSYRNTLSVPAQGSVPSLDGVDDRLSIAQMVIKPDGTKTLWAAQATRANSSGIGCGVSSCDRNAVRFYEIGNMTTTPSMVQSATFFDSSASNWNYYWIPSVNTSGQGHTIMASAYAGAANFAGIAITGRLFTDPLGSLNSSPQFIASSASYNVQTTGPIVSLGTITGGSGYTNGTYNGVALTGGTGTSATANITVSGNAVTAVTLVNSGNGYKINDVLSAAASSIGGTGSGFSVPVALIPPQRWGDFTNTVVDPADNMTMWTFQEFTNAANSWGLQAVKILAPPPAALSSVSPATVNAGTTINITLTGTSSNGSGFYDPGAGFPNRLAASVSGTGVTVNSVTPVPGVIATLGTITGGSGYTNGTYNAVALTGGSGTGATANITVSGNKVTTVTIVSGGLGYNVNDTLSAATSSIGGTGSGFSVPVTSTRPDTTHLTLNLTIALSAVLGGRTITVTNPDGQSVTSAANFLTIGAAVTVNLSPGTLPAATLNVAYSQTVTASGGVAPYTYSIASGALATGLTLNSSTGTISGTPTKSGTSNFTISAQDSLADIGTQAYTVAVQTLLTSTVSLPLVSTAYDATPVPGYNGGRFTLNTSLTNNGATINATSQLYFRISALFKYLNPSPNDALLTADNGAGQTGDIQTVNLGGVNLGTGQSIPIAFTIGVTTKNTFNIGLDLYMVPLGSAMTVSGMLVKGADGKPNLQSGITGLRDLTVETSADTTQPAPILMGQFVFTGTETSNPPGSGNSTLTSGSFSNVGVIIGPGAQSRPAVAVDPILPNRIAIASNDYLSRSIRVTTSSDGGANWYNTTLSPTAGGTTFFVAQNPSLAFDSFGRLTVVYSVANLQNSANAIVISESTDLKHFSDTPTVLTYQSASGQSIDSRPVIAIDSNLGRVVAWDRLDQTSSSYSIMAARSPEGGLFDAPVTVVANGLVSSPALALNKNTVFLGWDDWGFNSSRPYTSGGRLMVAVSPDAKTLRFESPSQITTTSIGFGQRIPAMPDAGVGPSLGLATDPKNEENVYAVFADRRSATGIDIQFGHSGNRGKAWQFLKVNNDTGNADHFDPSITVNPAGSVNVGFYDTRLSSTSQTAHVFLARSLTNGSSFDNQRVTTALINDSLTNPLRDTTADLGSRTAVTMMNGDVLIAWTDTRNNSEDIFASAVFDPTGQSITGQGTIKFAAGSYAPNTSISGQAEFGFEAGYRKGSSVPDGSFEFKFQAGKTKFEFTSNSYQSLIVLGDTAQVQGTGKINGAGAYAFKLTASDGDKSGTGIDKFRLSITDTATGAPIYDNSSGSADALNDTVLQPIGGGRIEIRLNSAID